jgi:hypothetical protein
MKTICLVALLGSIMIGLAYAAEESSGGYTNKPEGEQIEYLKTLKEGSWICTGPEAYDQAIEEQRKWQGKDLEELKKQLLDKKLCMYLDHEYAEKIMHPSVKVLERQGDKIKVTFAVEFRKRFELLHHQISRIVLAGWTNEKNLIDYIP